MNYIFLSNSSVSGDINNSNNNTFVQKEKALVIIDDWNMIETHSMFWEQIRNSYYDIEFRMIDDSDIKLDFYGEKLYDSVIICTPSLTEDHLKSTDLNIKKLIKHFDKGLNIMIIADKNVHSYLRSLVTEFGVDFDDYDSHVKDSLYLHSHKDYINKELVEARNNEIVVTRNVIPIKNVFHAPINYILYEGIGLELDSHNQYLFPLLKADENSYSVNSDTGLYYNFGDKIKLVAGYQGRNNKRVTITGSSNLCSNKFYFLSSLDSNPLNSPNAVFCQELILWNLQKTGVIKYENERHQRKSDGKTLDIYRVKDELEFFVDIYEYDYKANNWKPYLTDDLQIEYTMMDPFYRLQLKMVSLGKPTYYVSFKVFF